MTEPTSAHLSDYDVRREGWLALTERLGVSGAMRFLSQYDPGRSDYVEERKRLFAGLTLDEALRAIEARGDA